MEHMKNIGAGLLGLAFIATCFAVVITAVATTLQVFDWIQLHHTAMTMPALYTVAALFTVMVAWLIGSNMRKAT